MKSIVLFFPDTESFADFLVQQEINSVEACSDQLCLKGVLTIDQILLASSQYGAIEYPLEKWMALDKWLRLAYEQAAQHSALNLQLTKRKPLTFLGTSAASGYFNSTSNN